MLEIVERSRELLVLNKPTGISFHRDRNGATDFWSAIRSEFPAARPVHRIDKGTSGVVIVALSRAMQSRVTRMFGSRSVRKHYVGVVCGHLPTGRTLTVVLPLRPGRKRRFRVAGARGDIEASGGGWTISSRDGYPSLTRMRVLLHGSDRSLVALQPVTGRTHQIRVHLAWIGHPIVGDTIYGKPSSPAQQASRLMLHCRRIVLPGIGSYSMEMPSDWQQQSEEFG